MIITTHNLNYPCYTINTNQCVLSCSKNDVLLCKCSLRVYPTVRRNKYRA